MEIDDAIKQFVDIVKDLIQANQVNIFSPNFMQLYKDYSDNLSETMVPL